MSAVSLIIHIPHSSTFIPDEHRKMLLPDDEHLKKELLSMTDLYTDELFQYNAERLVFPVNRLICDVERFRDDENEPMSERGMGAVYTRCHDLTALRCEDLALRENILQNWYDPHHKKLDELVTVMLERDGHCIIIDGHSFSPVPLPYEPIQDIERPDICIGTDPFHTPSNLAELCKNAFEKQGYTTMFNTPYKGSIVPLRFYQKDKRVSSVMFELNRKLYMDNNGNRTEGFAPLCYAVKEVIIEVAFSEQG